MNYPVATLYAFPQPVPEHLGAGMDTLTYMVASALPGALATTSPTIAARMAFEAACVACELIDRYQQQGGNPLSVLSVASAAPPVPETPQGERCIDYDEIAKAVHYYTGEDVDVLVARYRSESSPAPAVPPQEGR